MKVTEFLSKALKKDERFKEVQKEMRIQRIIQERQKGANERELERFVEEERQKKIDKHLDEFRKQKQEEHWKGNNLTNQKNIFKGHQSIMENNDKLFEVKKAKSKGGMFFK